jgi:multiple sugar transport system substrate-binding protein
MSRRITFYQAMTALVLLLVLTACGGTGIGQSGKTKLKIWFAGNTAPEITFMTKTLVPAFEKAHSNLQLDLQYIDWGNLSPKLNSAFAGNLAPDVFMHGPAATAGFVEADRVLPLDTYISHLDEQTRNDFGSLLDGGLVGSHRYMIPLSGQGLLFAYRTDYFQQAGLDPAHPPTKWEDFLAAAQKLTQREGGKITRAGVIMNTKGYNIQQAYNAFLFPAGGELLSADNKTAAWNNAAGVKALQYLIDLYRSPNAVATGQDIDYGALPAAQQPLLTGQAAMQLVVPAQLGNMQQANPAVFKNIAVMPPLEDEKTVGFGGAGPGLFINKDSKHPDDAWSFIKYMMETETLKQYCSAAGTVPPRASFLNSDLVQQRPYLKTFIASFNQLKGNPNVPTWVALRDILARYLSQAVAGQSSAKDALDAAANEANKVIAGG